MRVQFSEHAAHRLEQRGLTRGSVVKALKEGDVIAKEGSVVKIESEQGLRHPLHVVFDFIAGVVVTVYFAGAANGVFAG